MFEAYSTDDLSLGTVILGTGTPTAWNPLVSGYDRPLYPPHHDPLSSLPAEVVSRCTASQTVVPSAAELARLRSTLRSLFEAGPGSSEENTDLRESENESAEDGVVAGVSTPIPADIFLEELSQKLQVHPISVYWLLEELRAEGVRCKPEELRVLEDRLSVIVLRVLGHRWPRQFEAGEPVPPWADSDGIIPLTPIVGETSLAERLRDRLRDEDGDRGAQQVEALLLELTGQTLEEWLRRTFFSRHVRQFKHRPIAWHLASTPSKEGSRRGKVKREPAFQCLLYYHACRGDGASPPARARRRAAHWSRNRGRLRRPQPWRRDRRCTRRFQRARA